MVAGMRPLRSARAVEDWTRVDRVAVAAPLASPDLSDNRVVARFIGIVHLACKDDRRLPGASAGGTTGPLAKKAKKVSVARESVAREIQAQAVSNAEVVILCATK